MQCRPFSARLGEAVLQQKLLEILRMPNITGATSASCFPRKLEVRGHVIEVEIPRTQKPVGASARCSICFYGRRGGREGGCASWHMLACSIFAPRLQDSTLMSATSSGLAGRCFSLGLQLAVSLSHSLSLSLADSLARSRSLSLSLVRSLACIYTDI